MVSAILADRYRLEAELGRGGMGVVYRAHDTLLDRDVAVKVLSTPRLGTEGRARLLREAQAAAGLNHRNIVTVHDVGEADGAPFVVMELVEGQSLHDHRPESLEETVAVARQVCAALEHAHARGIVHRDLKPENVLLAAADATAKLVDFGLARSMTSRLTAEGAIAGTVFYLAPELALGQAYDGRADLYALGAMLYEMTTGRLPFLADDPLAVISQHLHAPVVPPRARDESIPPALDALILCLLSKDRQDRPASAAEVRRALEAPGILDREAAPERELSVLERIERGRLVARERELAEARALWQKASAGEGGMLLVCGEPGIGKTRMVRELCTEVQVAGDRVLVGECYAEGGAPYAPFAQVLRRAFRDGAGDELAEAYTLEEVGEEEEIEATLQELLDLVARGMVTAVWALCLQSVVRARRGEPGAARHLLAQAHQEAAERGELMIWIPRLSAVEAYLAMAEEHWPEALAAFEATVDALGQAKARWYQARIRIDWAEAYLSRDESGDRARAEELLREAQTEFEAMGAPIYVERVKARLAQLGGVRT